MNATQITALRNALEELRNKADVLQEQADTFDTPEGRRFWAYLKALQTIVVASKVMPDLSSRSLPLRTSQGDCDHA